MPRKEYTIHYIYKTTNIITGKFYVGMHSTFNTNDDYLGSGKILWYSIKKYGKENHKKEILEFCKNKIELKKRENEIVNEDMIHDKMCMNLMRGGQGGFISVEQQKRFSAGGNKVLKEKFKNDIEFRNKFGKTCSNNLKEQYKSGKRKKIYFYDWTGKNHTDETKRKIGLKNSINQQGKNNSNYGNVWVYNNKLLISKLIPKKELKNYILDDWIKGRKMFN